MTRRAGRRARGRRAFRDVDAGSIHYGDDRLAASSRTSTTPGDRRFLGSDPLTGHALNELCDEQIVLSESFVMSENIANLAASLEQIILLDPSIPEPEAVGGDGVGIIATRFYPELLDAVVAEAKSLVEGAGVSPADIVVVSPFLSDALRFSDRTSVLLAACFGSLV